MKKVLALLLACVMALLLLSACAPAKAPAAQAPAADKAADAADAGTADDSKTFKIGLTLAERDQFLSGMEGAIIAAAKEKGCELVPFDAQANTEKQLEHIQAFALGDYDLIIVNLTDTNTGEDIIELVGWDKPLVFVDRRPSDELMKDDVRCYVGAEEYLAGMYQAEYLAEYFKDKADKTLDVVLFKGRLGLENVEQRSLGAIETLEKAGFTVNLVFDDTANWDRVISVDKVATFLGTGKSFDCVICNNDEMALGVIEAMDLAGVDPSKTPIVGIDGTEMGLDAIRNGKMAMTAYQSPIDVGRACFDQAYSVLTTGKMSAFKDVPFIVITGSNINEYFS